MEEQAPLGLWTKLKTQTFTFFFLKDGFCHVLFTSTVLQGTSGGKLVHFMDSG